MILETHMKFCVREQDFLSFKNRESGAEMGFFEFIEKFGL